MENYALESLLAKTGSLFKLSNLAAARSRELNEGMKKLVDSEPNEKLTTTAIREIMNDRITLKKKK